MNNPKPLPYWLTLFFVFAAALYMLPFFALGQQQEVVIPHSCEKIRIAIHTDDDPAWTKWQVLDKASGALLASGGSYAMRNHYYYESLCLAPGMYTFKFATANRSQSSTYSITDSRLKVLASIDDYANGSGREADFCVEEANISSCPSFEETNQVKFAGDGKNENYGYKGQAVAIDGSLAAVGAPGESAVYVYRYDGLNWKREARLSYSYSVLGYGNKVAVSGNTIVVSAQAGREFERYYVDYQSKSSAELYVYEYVEGAWELQATLSTGTRHSYDEEWFGWDFSIEGDVLVVGAKNENDKGEDTGAAFVYKKVNNQWQLQQKLFAADADVADYFGFSVDVKGNNIVVGAIGDDENGTNAGAAYIFHYNGTSWQQQAKLMKGSNLQLGYLSSISDTTLAVGVENRYFAGVYMYHLRDGEWIEHSLLKDTNHSSGEKYGFTMDLTGNTLAVGIFNDPDTDVYQDGSVALYQLRNDVWQLEKKIMASDARTVDDFSSSVGLSGSMLVVGSRSSSDYIRDGGAVYFYRHTFQGTNQPPLVAPNQSFNVDEHAPAGHVIGNVVATDKEGDPLSFTITAGNINNTFVLDGRTGQLGVANAAVLDFEKSPTFSLGVAVSDGKASTEAIISIKLNNLNDNAPAVSCKSLNISLDSGCEVVAEAFDFDNGTTDADGDPITFTVSPAGPYPLGETTVVLKADDGKNTSSCTTTITLTDPIAPVAVARDITVQLNAHGAATITAAQLNDGSTDNCTAAAALRLSLNKESFTCEDVGSNTVVLMVTDASGNSSTATATVMVALHKAEPTLSGSWPENIVYNTVASFSIDEIPGAEGYLWTVPAGFEIVSGENSPGIQLRALSGTASGELSVRALHACGEGEALAKAVFAAKAPAVVTITGLNQQFTGEPLPVTVSTAPAGIGVEVSYDGTATIPVSEGEYAVLAVTVDENYVGESSATYLISAPTAASDADIVDDVLLYPNPTTGRARLELKPGAVAEVTLTDVFGREIVCATVLDSYDLELEGKAAGLYFIQVKIGKTATRLKLLKQ